MLTLSRNLSTLKCLTECRGYAQKTWLIVLVHSKHSALGPSASPMLNSTGCIFFSCKWPKPALSMLKQNWILVACGWKELLYGPVTRDSVTPRCFICLSICYLCWCPHLWLAWPYFVLPQKSSFLLWVSKNLCGTKLLIFGDLFDTSA